VTEPIKIKSGMPLGTVLALLVETVSLLHDRCTDLERRAEQIENGTDRTENRLQALIDHLNEHTAAGAP
jgi:hypothetical protein